MKGNRTMKKIIALLLTVMTVMTMSLSVFAAPGNFVQSPSNNADPELIGFEITPPCDGYLKLTSYSKRHTLPEADRKAIEAAYDEIVNAIDLSAFCDIFASHLNKNKIDAKDVLVSDLFDVSLFGCTHAEPHDGFIITVKFESLEGFAGLLHRENGEWKMVEDVTVDADGKTMTFKVSSLSPFAVAVDTSNEPPFTGDNNHLIAYAAVAVLSAAALGVVFFKLKASSKVK